MQKNFNTSNSHDFRLREDLRKSYYQKHVTNIVNNVRYLSVSRGEEFNGEKCEKFYEVGGHACISFH